MQARGALVDASSPRQCPGLQSELSNGVGRVTGCGSTEVALEESGKLRQVPPTESSAERLSGRALVETTISLQTLRRPACDNFVDSAAGADVEARPLARDPVSRGVGSLLQQAGGLLPAPLNRQLLRARQGVGGFEAVVEVDIRVTLIGFQIIWGVRGVWFRALQLSA